MKNMMLNWQYNGLVSVWLKNDVVEELAVIVDLSVVQVAVLMVLIVLMVLMAPLVAASLLLVVFHSPQHLGCSRPVIKAQDHDNIC